MNFEDMAREWLVRAQGHSRPEHEKSLAKELQRAWELGIANAIEEVRNAAYTNDGNLIMPPVEGDEVIEALRALVTTRARND